MLSWAVKLNIRQALDVLGTQQSNGKAPQIYVMVTRTASTTANRNVTIQHDHFLSASSRWSASGFFTHVNSLMWKRNMLKSMLQTIQKLEKEKRPRIQTSKRDDWRSQCLREIQPRDWIGLRQPIRCWVWLQEIRYVTLIYPSPFLSRNKSEGYGDVSASYSNRLWKHIICHVI